jgi:hypothetical protein
MLFAASSFSASATAWPSPAASERLARLDRASSEQQITQQGCETHTHTQKHKHTCLTGRHAKLPRHSRGMHTAPLCAKECAQMRTTEEPAHAHVCTLHAALVPGISYRGLVLGCPCHCIRLETACSYRPHARRASASGDAADPSRVAARDTGLRALLVVPPAAPGQPRARRTRRAIASVHELGWTSEGNFFFSLGELGCDILSESWVRQASGSLPDGGYPPAASTMEGRMGRITFRPS